MKRTIALILAAAMMLALVPATALAADGDMTVVQNKDKFYVGETISRSNFTVTYEDQGEKFIVTNYTFKKSASATGASSVSYSKPGVYELLVSYTPDTGDDAGVEKTEPVSVSVYSKAAYLDVTLSSNGTARQTAGFVAGDTLSAADFIVEYYTADATAATKTLAAGEYTFTPSKLAAGSNTITFTHSAAKGTFTIDGVLPKNEPALIIGGTCKTEYGIGETFEPAGLTFTYQPRNSTSEAQVSVDLTDIVITPSIVFSEKGDKTINFTYTDPATNETVTATKTIKVVGRLKRLDLTGTLTKTFYAGDVFDPTGLTATVYQYDGTAYGSPHIFAPGDDGDYTYSRTPLKYGQTSIEITYTDEATGESVKRAVDINVNKKVKELLHTAGTIKTYYVGDTFDPTGLTFDIVYNTKTGGVNDKDTITGATAGAYSKLSWSSAAFTKAGNVTFEVKYTDDLSGETVACSLTLVVKDPKAAKLEAATVQENLQVVVGDDFDPDKLFEVTYQKANTDGFEQIYFNPAGGGTAEYTISPNPTTFTEAGTQTFTITKGDLSATVTVTVLPVIKLMTVSGAGSLKLYGGHEFDPTGLTVTIYYNKGTLWETADVKANKILDAATCTDADGYKAAGLSWPAGKLQAPKKTITLTYTDADTGATATKDFEATINYWLKELKVEQPGTAVEFFADEPFSADGLDITLTYGDDTTNTALTDAALSYDKAKLSAGANQSIQISYTDTDSGETISCEFVFTVKATSYTDETWDGEPTKTYTEGETFDPSGIMLTATKNGGATPVTITSGFKVYPDRALKPSDTSVVVTYGNLAKVYDITVTGRTLTKIAVTTKPDAASFYVGQSFDPTGMVVTASYNNKTTAEVTGYTYDTAAFAETDIGTKTITLTYKEGVMTTTTTLTMPIVAAPVKSRSLVLSKSQIESIEGKEEQLTATVYPTTASNKSLVWTSSDTAVARVDQSGLVTVVGKGECVISATTTDGSNRYADCYLKAAAKVPVTKLVLKATTMELLVNDATTLTTTVTPATATLTTPKWTSSNAEIVTVDETGKVTGVKLGSATITATVDGVAASMTIKVVSVLSKFGTVVNCSRRVNVRASADGASKSIGYAYLDATYTILGESGNWYKIQFSTSKVGYIWKEYLKESGQSYTSESTGAGTTTSTPTTAPTTTPAPGTTVYTKLTVINCNRYCYVRKGAGTNTSKVGHAKPGEEYKLLGASGDWYLIDFNGSQAYIYNVFGKLS